MKPTKLGRICLWKLCTRTEWFAAEAFHTAKFQSFVFLSDGKTEGFLSVTSVSIFLQFNDTQL